MLQRRRGGGVEESAASISGLLVCSNNVNTQTYKDITVELSVQEFYIL
jgi:hypothetical protein